MKRNEQSARKYEKELDKEHKRIDEESKLRLYHGGSVFEEIEIEE